MSSDANTASTAPRLGRLLVVGLVAGFFSALFGVGGGIVMVPLLIAWLAFDVKSATATSLAAIIITATVGVIAHGSLGNVAWGYALLIGLPALGGLLVGLEIKDRLSSRSLTLAFAGLLTAVAIWLAVEPTAAESSQPSVTAGRAVAVIALGVLAGALAALFGVGGGILFVPALALIVGLPQLAAEGASLLAIIPVSLVGSWRQHRARMIRWRDAVTMGVASAGTAVAGALVADATPPRTLRVLFSLLVIFTAVQLARRVASRARR